MSDQASVILFCGDPHWEFGQVLQAAHALKPMAIVLLGDLLARRPLHDELAAIRDRVRVRVISWCLDGCSSRFSAASSGVPRMGSVRRKAGTHRRQPSAICRRPPRAASRLVESRTSSECAGQDQRTARIKYAGFWAQWIAISFLPAA